MLLQNKKPLIFLAFANVREENVPYLRNLPDEQRQIRDALEKAKSAGLCEIVERSNATTKEILDVFQHPEYRNRITIFHYGGHANGFQLLLESSTGSSSPAYAGGFAEFLGQQQGLQLVFLNGCSTQPQVHGLLQANVSVVIATSQSIVDSIATNLAVRFYTGLASGASIRTAYNEAVASIKTEIGEDLLQYYLEAAGGENRWPWDIYINDGAEITDHWNLPDAADDPTFGLPSVPHGDLPLKPFRHLHWFTREHAEVFFGREYQIRELYDRITSPHTAPIILCYGQSGVGKSSLLAAGLIPRLENGFEVRYQRKIKEVGLLGSLKEAISSPGEIPIAQAWLEMEDQLKKPIVIILDQVEDIFTNPNIANPSEFQEFVNSLKLIFVNRINRPNGKLILSFRKEWLAEIEKRFKQHKLPSNLVFLERLDRRGIIAAVTGLTQSKRLQDHYGLTLDEELAELIADDLTIDPESPIAPTLQILLTKMWDAARRRQYSHPHFSIELYQRLKKQGILLKDFLEQQFDRLHRWRPEVVESGLVLDILVLHTTPLGTAEQCKRSHLRRSYSHQQELLPALIQKCKDRYLLIDPVKDQPGGERSRATRLAHDTLAPIIRQKYEMSDKPGQRAARILAAKMFDFIKQKTDIWLDEADLVIVENGMSGMRQLTEKENVLLQNSRKRREHNKRIRRTIWCSGSLMVLLVVVMAMFAWRNMINARQQERIARTNYLTILANDVFKTDTTRALRISQAAYDLVTENPPVFLHQLMHTIYYSQPQRKLFTRHFSHDAMVTSAIFSSDGEQILTASWDKTVKLWTLDGDLITVFKHDVPITSVAFSPENDRIVCGTCDNRAKLCTISGESLVIFKHNSQVNAVVFSPDGELILTASSDSTAKLWTTTGESLAVFRHQDQVYSAMFSPDGQKILTASFDNTARLWTLAGDSINVFRHNDRVYSAVFSPDGEKILTASSDQTARLWRQNGDSIAILVHNQPLLSSVISPDGSKILTVGTNNCAKLWTIDGDSIGVFKHTHPIYEASFSLDSKMILMASGDKTARLWLAPEGIYDWLQTARIYQLSEQEKREYRIIG